MKLSFKVLFVFHCNKFKVYYKYLIRLTIIRKYSTVSNISHIVLTIIFTMFIVCFLCLFLAVVSLEVEERPFDIIWTDQVESELLTEDEHKIAFRDVVLEGD